MSEEDVFEEDEISLFDIFEKLRAGWRWVVGGVLVGVLGAAAMIAITQPQYEASAILQTGKVDGAVIEDSSTVAERLKAPGFLLEIAREADDQAWVEAINAGNGAQVLTVQIPKTSPSMVELKVRARSPEAAKKIADEATAKLIKRQEELSTQIIEKIRFDTNVAKEKLNKAEQDLSLLSKTISATSVNNERFSQISLLTSLKLQKESDTFALRQTVFKLENSLLPPSTQPARVLEAIFVSGKVVSPKKGLLLALGLVGGLLLGMVLVFVSGAWRQARVRRSVGG